MIMHWSTLTWSLALAVEVASDGCKVGDMTYSTGEAHIIPGFCSHRICQGNDDWSLDACPYTDIPPGWTYSPHNPALPYPECCGKAIPPLSLVPDVLKCLSPSTGKLEVVYGDLHVDNGNDLTPTQVRDEPTVSYPVNPGAYYLLAMVDPDAPSRKDPYLREFLHWLVGNIHGRNLVHRLPRYMLRRSATVLAAYVGSAPPEGTGFHRYFFLLYKQPFKINFDEPRIPNNTTENRTNFSIAKFAKKYNLCDPVAVNVFQAKYDRSVPGTLAAIGFT